MDDGPSAAERRLAAAALAKRRAGQRPSKDESRALRRVERHHGEQARLAAFRSIRKKEWSAWSGRQQKVLNEQAVRYAIPIAGPQIDLAAVVRWLHEFLAANARRLAGADDEDPLLAGVASPALERYRLARARREEFGLQRDLGHWLPREKVHEALAMFAGILRSAGETLQRQFGRHAHLILEQAVDDAVLLFHQSFDENQQQPEPDDSAAAPQRRPA